jgi:acetolactate synthase I/III small subunit
MPAHLLAVVAGPGRDVPSRVAGLLLPSDIDVIGMQFSRPPGSGLWWIQLTVDVPSLERLELLTKRLNRLVDVLKVRTLTDPRW